MRGYINWLDSLPYKQDVMGSSPLPRTNGLLHPKQFYVEVAEACKKIRIHGECGGLGRHTGLWFRRRGIASSSLVTYPRVV